MMYLFIPTSLQNEYLGLESKIIKSKIHVSITGFSGVDYLSWAQISFIVCSWAKPVGTALEGVLAQYQFLFETGLAKVLPPGIWR